MNRFKTALLATIAVSAFAASAQAQVPLPAPGPNNGDAALHGAGATAIQNVVVQENNCIGVDNQLGVSNPNPNGRFETIAAFNYVPTSPTATNPAFNCATQNIQPNFSSKYIATGSGFGRQIWREFQDRFDGATGGVAGVNNPFNEISGQARWTNVQYAFSEAAASPSDLTAYTANANSTTNRAGPAVQFPLYVVPVAVAYNPVYGRNAGGTAMRFNVRNPRSLNGTSVGGLRMSRELYCKVFNGTVTNFNNALFTSANRVANGGGTGTALFDPVNDTSARWAADGVPIRLVGRLDRSGTTDLFTRHIAAACNGFAGLTNKYTATSAESLPYARVTGAPDFSGVRADTAYSLSSAAPLAGATNLISRDYFTGTAIASVANGSTSLPTGNVGSGLFLIADGSGRVRDAINFAPDYALNGVTLNGKIGYIAADFIASSPSGSPTLFAAALRRGGATGQTSTDYIVPGAADSIAAFGGTTPILPPQSATSGAFNLTDTRQVRLPAGGTGNATRNNPLAWVDVLYAGTNTLAAPTNGYPITGTSQYLGYTCYKSAGNRFNVVEFVALNFGAITKDSANNNVSATLFDGTLSTSLGLLAKSNIGAMPNAWQRAIEQTFLISSTETSGGQALNTLGNGGNGLWIQNKYPTIASDVDTTPNAGDPVSNPGCTVGTGA